MTVHHGRNEASSSKRQLAMAVVTIVTWALVIGLSPGLTITVAALALMLVDRYDGAILDRLTGQRGSDYLAE